MCSECITLSCVLFFFFSSRRRHTRSTRDWSSDVCSSDLGAKLLARRFGTMKALRNASVEEISKIRGVGMAIAEAVAGFFDETKNRKLLERLEKLGLNFTEPTITEGKGPLAGQTYVVTGTLPSLDRKSVV